MPREGPASCGASEDSAAQDGAPPHAGARCRGAAVRAAARIARRDQSTAAADHDEGRNTIGSTDHTVGLHAAISGEIAADAGCSDQ